MKKRKINKKLVKIKESDIEIQVEEQDDYYYIRFSIDDIIEAAPRPRVGKYGSLYDPNSSYKNYIKRTVKEQMENFDYSPLDSQIEIFTYISFVPPKFFSDKKTIYALRGDIKPKIKPDNDNFEKTIFDLFKNILWQDDSQIYFNQTEKKYDFNKKTEVIIIVYKENDFKSCSGRLTKEELNSLSEEEKNFLLKRKGKEGVSDE